MHSILIASIKFVENKFFIFPSESETQRIKENKIKKLLLIKFVLSVLY
jgi:hypothetical protein